MDQFAAQTAALGWPLTNEQLNQFARYQALLIDWNQHMNLTAIRKPELIQQRHFLDSLTCSTVIPCLKDIRLIDVGTGAGFPGLPLKIFCPQLQLTLVDSVVKKLRFLQAVVDELGLTDVTIVAERAEVLGRQTEHRGLYDWAVARGVAELRILVEYLLPLCRLGGHVLAQKGGNAHVEAADAAQALATLGGSSPLISPVQLPNRKATHYLVVIEKVAESPDRYPRRTGIPIKRPL